MANTANTDAVIRARVHVQVVAQVLVLAAVKVVAEVLAHIAVKTHARVIVKGLAAVDVAA